ncbi:MAG: hypothetical protein QOJ72_1388 [Nocardioidaceae bacterium]|nr:hypothetical protein [Nocardioidaceae bacterium]
MTIVIDVVTPPCAAAPDVYHDEYLNNPPARHEVSGAEWNLLTAKRAAAHKRCAGCPLLISCLYRAVVEVDVSGFVACTTEDERQTIRRQLGIEVQESSMTPYGAPRVGGGPVSHEAVMTARHAYPKDTCQQLAERLECSTSTIKRHLRRDRDRKIEAARSEMTLNDLPTVDAVLDAFDLLESSHVA